MLAVSLKKIHQLRISKTINDKTYNEGTKMKISEQGIRINQQ